MKPFTPNYSVSPQQNLADAKGIPCEDPTKCLSPEAVFELAKLTGISWKKWMEIDVRWTIARIMKEESQRECE